MNHFPASDALCALPAPLLPGFGASGPVRPGHDRDQSVSLPAHPRLRPLAERQRPRRGSALDSLDDWSRLPPILASFFKQQLLLSPTGENALELTSSGTSGQKSRMRYDPRSLSAAQFMVERDL
jgi:hypothetical protein